jgi:phosphatidylserine/phosphatidylglycerophosphate/cardiolipin synthase-like enzyme
MGMFISNSIFANKIKLLEQNTEALQARVDLILNAKKDIYVEYYEVESDAFSLTGLSLLRQAADNGIKVKILIDSLHNHLSKLEMAAITGKNLEIKVFNPLHSINPLHLLYRNHEKLFIVDGGTEKATMIVGGRNASRNYFGKALDISFKDLDSLVQGKSVNDAYEYYKKLWELNPEVKQVNLKEYSEDSLLKSCIESDNVYFCEKNKHNLLKEINLKKQEIKSYYDFFMAGNAWVKEEKIEKMLADIEEVDEIKFVYNDPTKKMSQVENKISSQIMNYILKNTNHHLLIITPYLFPTDNELQVLEQLSQNGIKIKIVTNSLVSNDVVLVHAAFLTIKKRLAEMGIELYLYNGPETIHAKAAILDNKISFIGSFNFDRKSSDYNREIGIRVGNSNSNSSQFTIDMLKFINDEVILNSTLIAKDKIEFDFSDLDRKASPEKIKKLNKSKKLVKLLKNVI